ncbi:MAG: class I adenylate-forming enzyme family protein [Firmicutes bacterium]|nr:class I adenylate-forming enzyme family protein [Bacillota bacterium]
MTLWRYHWPEVADLIEVNQAGEWAYPQLDRTDIVHAFYRLAMENSQRLSLRQDSDDWSYERLIRAISRMATHLRQEGIGAGDRVALVLPNSIEFVVAFFATLWVGAMAVPLNPGLGPEEFRRVLTDASPRMLLYLADIVPELAVPADCQVLGLDRRTWSIAGNEISEPAGANPDRVAVILYTSGTAGNPKGVMLTHRNILTSVTSYQRIFHLHTDDRTLIVVPLFHVTGLIGQLLAVLLSGGAAVLVRKYHASDFMDLLYRQDITFLFTVPTILTLAFLRDKGWAVPQRLRILASGGAPIAPALIAQIQETLPDCAFYNTYGMTEVASPATILRPADWAQHPSSVGLPVPGMTMRIMDINEHKPLAVNEVGELWMRGPMVTPGYWNRPEVTAETVKDGWLRSGDLASIDAAGYVTIHGRMKDMINRGGEKVYPIDVEGPLGEHPAVMEVAVYGVPDAVWGEHVACALSLKPGLTATAEELCGWLESRVARFKIPTEYRLWHELPRNANGKIDKRRLQEAHELTPLLP